MEIRAQDIPENSVVCFRYSNFDDPEDIVRSDVILMSRWTREIKSLYEFTHSEPYTPEKGNREPVFPQAVYKFVKLSDQTPENLKRIYLESQKEPIRTKIQSCHLLFILESP